MWKPFIIGLILHDLNINPLSTELASQVSSLSAELTPQVKPLSVELLEIRELRKESVAC